MHTRITKLVDKCGYGLVVYDKSIELFPDMKHML